MLPVLHKKLNQLNDSLDRLLAIMDQAESDHRTRKPSSNKWSPIQILYHIKLSEQASIGYLTKKMTVIDSLPDTTISNSYKSWLLSLALWSPLKFKAPSVVADIPDVPDYELLKEEFRDLRSELRTLMSNLEEQHLQRTVMKHPRIGPINIVQTMSFFQSHFVHHERQIRNLLPAG